jgi:flagellar biosynthetic protein FliR
MHYAAPFALIMARVSGVFLFTPMLSGSTLPARARVMLTLSLATAVFAFGPTSVRELPPLDLVTYVPLMFSEVLLGASIGLIGGLPLILVQLAGSLMGYQMGLGIAQTFNPSVESQGDVVGSCCSIWA